MSHARFSFVLLSLLGIALLRPTSAIAQESQALVLDGGGDYAEAADSDDLNITGEAITMEAWTKHDGDSDGTGTIVEKFEAGLNGQGYQLRLEGSGEEAGVTARLREVGSVTVEGGVPSGRWTHVAAVYDGEALSLYINGEPAAANEEASGSLGTTNRPLRIGADQQPDKFFSGRIDEVRVWREARSQTQIREHRFGELEGSDPQLAAYYPFPAGDPTADLGGPENDSLTFFGDAEAIAPDALPVPPDVFVEDEGPGEVRLRWEERTGPNGENAAEEFGVYRSPPTGLGDRNQIQTVSAPDNSHTATGLTNGETSFFEVTSVNGQGQESDFSMFVPGTPHAGDEAEPMRGGAALALDGIGDFGEVSKRPLLDITGEAITMEAWIKHDGDSDANATIVEKFEAGLNGQGYQLRLEGSGEEAGVTARLREVGDVTVEGGVPYGRWTHVAAVYDGEAHSLYLNGEPAAANEGASGSLGAANSPLKIGVDGGEEQFFSGRIDEVRIWDVARSAEAIEASYRQELVGNEEGLRGYWRFNDAGKEVRQGMSPGDTRQRSNVDLRGDALVQGPGALPGPPTTYARAGDEAAQIFWDDRGADVADQYGIYRATGPDGAGRIGLSTRPAADRSYVDDGASNSTNYFYEVTSLNEEGQESDFALHAPATPSDRPFGNALSLDGAGDFGEISDRPLLDITGEAITMEAWIKHDGESDANATIVEKFEGGLNGRGYQLRLEGSGEEVGVTARLREVGDVTVEGGVVSGRWTHVAAVYDGEAHSLYLNGEPAATNEGASGSFRANNSPLKIGVDGGEEQFFSGRIDEVRIWDVPRSGEAIEASYRQELVGNEEGLRSYFRLNETPGTAVPRAAGPWPLTLDLKGDADFAPSMPLAQHPLIAPAADAFQQSGSEFWVDIGVGSEEAPVSDLFETGFVLDYDESRLSVAASELGDFFGENVDFSANDDPSVGEITIEVSRPSGAGGVDGSGTVARVKFELGTGVPNGTELPFALAGVEAQDPDGNAIPLSPKEQSVRAGEPPAVAVSKRVADNGPVEFGETGVEIDFSGVEGADSVTVEKFDEGPDEASGISEANVSNFRFVIKATRGVAFGSAELRLGVSSLGGIEEDPSTVEIYKREQLGVGTYERLETTVDDNGTPDDISDDVLWGTVANFSGFALASDSEPLPVEMAGFEVITTESGVRLSWQTVSETNNAGFEIQRRVGTGERGSARAWEEVGFVDSKVEGGTTNEPQSYRFEDEDLPFAADRLGYRLRQVNLDGSENLIDPVEIERTVERLQLRKTFPNPAHGQATVQFAVPDAQDVRLALYDVLGRQVQIVSEGEIQGRRELQVDLSDLPSGAYFLRLRTSGVTKTQRLTVVR